MYFSYLDTAAVSKSATLKAAKKLTAYRDRVQDTKTVLDDSVPEYALFHAAQPELHATLDALKKQFRNISHLVLVGIGGSNLGTEAVHEALGSSEVTLHTLDTASAHRITQLQKDLSTIRSAKKIAVCVISKSGGTAETLVNAGILLRALKEKYGTDIYAQTIFIGNPDTDFMKVGKRLKVTTVSMPEVVGGRYSVGTEVGLVPLALLKHDTDAYIEGVLDATAAQFDSVVVDHAARLFQYIQKGFRHYNFFAFDTRLVKLAAWYRQLYAESIGKETDRSGKSFTKGFVPTISTPTELHSVGQLYLSGFSGVYTDFVTFDDDADDYKIPSSGISKGYSGHTVQEVATAIYGGVMAAYQERGLPYRSTIFADSSLDYSMGLFMGMRMLEIMYLAELLNVNAFNQPNVELYKVKAKKILGV